MAEIQEIPLDSEDATEIVEENQTEITEENTEIAEEISAPPAEEISAPPAPPAPKPSPKPKAARAKGRPTGAKNKKPPRPKPPPPEEEEEEELPDYVQEAVHQQQPQPARAHDVATALFSMLQTHERDRRTARVNKYQRWVSAFS